MYVIAAAGEFQEIKLCSFVMLAMSDWKSFASWELLKIERRRVMAGKVAAKKEKPIEELLKDIREHCRKSECHGCKYGRLCNKLPNRWSDEDIESVAAG